MSKKDLITTSIAHHDGVVVLAVGGDIDLVTAPVLEAAIDDVLAENPQALIIELSGVEFLASAGLRILAATHEKLSQSSEYAVVANGPATSRPIQLTRLDEIFSLYPTLDEAMAAVRLKAD